MLGDWGRETGKGGAEGGRTGKGKGRIEGREGNTRVHKQDRWTRGFGNEGGRDERLDGTPACISQVREGKKSTHFCLAFYLIRGDSRPRF